MIFGISITFCIQIIALIIGIAIFFKISDLEHSTENKNRKISVIIPARNEDENLKRLLQTLKMQTYNIYEIIVVDDDSSDNTIKVAQEFYCKVAKVTELKKGVLGKPYACYSGYLEAEGEIFIFIDADVILSKYAIEKLVATYEKHGGVISVWPYYKIESFYENFSFILDLIVAVSFNCFSVINKLVKPKGLYGPFFLVARSDYESVGGHSSVFGEVVEDVALGKIFFNNGIKVNNFLGKRDVIFRMYPKGVKDLVSGWTKNFANGVLSTNLLAFIAIFVFITASISAAIKFSIFNFYSIVIYFSFVVEFLLFSKTIGDFSFVCSLFYPAYLAFFLLIFINSALRIFVFKSVVWKGRNIKTRWKL